MNQSHRDANSAIEERMLEAARSTPAWRKIRMAVDMSRTAQALTIAGLRHRHPDADEQEIRFRLAELLFGTDTAAALCRLQVKEADYNDS